MAESLYRPGWNAREITPLWCPHPVLVTLRWTAMPPENDLGPQLQAGPYLVAQPTPLHVSMYRHLPTGSPKAQSDAASLRSSCLRLPIQGNVVQGLPAAAYPRWLLVARKEQATVEQVQLLLSEPH